MRTEELHRKDAYLRSFEATVVRAEDDIVELDATAFYARGGGQQGDQGVLGGHQVVDTVVAQDRLSVLHRMAWTGDPLRAGDRVAGYVDWERRYALMRLHSAQHLLWLALTQEYGPEQQDRGGEIRPEKARLDVAWSKDERPSAEALTARLDTLVAADLPIERYVVDEGAGRWEWRIEGHPPIPCGGTHVRRTSEVGPLVVTVKGKGRDTARLTVAPVDR
ncbi:alanyl-tRNA editing protein [Streptomyces sp. ASQP_92]|uniref:alanyl-tRNA editing protein n=1 Tax=Streptomyces sp. ASQP_92 TaxID=2979116 RepID=UPI0021BECF06|nr:alanyl-tRNA editing protein [Streptomyces sp. ASQP_92]MCT9093209.1 alanyl-tRNA editing protein [Streptomyces sp. ASQP_92]